jgi:hypothetical protein
MRIPIAVIFIMIEDEHISSLLIRLIHAIIVKKVKSNKKNLNTAREGRRERESHKNVE